MVAYKDGLYVFGGKNTFFRQDLRKFHLGNLPLLVLSSPFSLSPSHRLTLLLPSKLNHSVSSSFLPNTDTLEWEKLNTFGEKKPSMRMGHTAVVYQDAM